MSKRFGRNQKRRLKAQLADAEKRLSEQREETRAARLDLDDAREGLNAARDTIDNVASVLGHHFVGLEPGQLDVGREGYRLRHIWREWELHSPPSISAMARPWQVSDYPVNETMHILKVTTVGPVAIEVDRLREQVHVNLCVEDTPFGYAISRRALHDAPLEYIAQRMANQMAPEILKQLRRAG